MLTALSPLTISASLLRVMLAHVQAEYPLEACGLLGGKNGRVTHLYAIENQLHSPTRYEMDPWQQIQAMLHIEAQEDEMLAIYHSHPHSPAAPSATDKALASYPGVIYVIISLQARSVPQVRGFLIEDDNVHEIEILKREA